MSNNNSNRASCSRGTSARSKHSARIIAQTTTDAKLHVDFEQSKQSFDDSTSVDTNVDVSSSMVSAYLQKMQRGSLIQPFGCIIAVDEISFSVLAYSENAPEMLDLTPHAVPNIEQRDALTIGTDIRGLFKSSGATALQKAAEYAEVNLLNPILVHCRTSGKPFYAIMHRIDVGLAIDFEPVNPADVPVTAAGAMKSYKLAAKAISKLQSLPSGNIPFLCEVLVQEISDLTGYDRVMVYKFHEDDHGEVIAEWKISDLEPYLGLHYPATDIPQASRFLFMKNKVRMIWDCTAAPVKVIQDTNLPQPLSLGGSTLRAPHGCHAQYMANMGSVASLVMSVTINDDDDDEVVNGQQKGRKLWGMQINKEVELARQLREKHILQTKTVLCDMLLRDAPIGIFTQSPNVMDLVKCNGAALYYHQKFWLLGVTPTEAQIRDIVEWLVEYHNASTGLSTDSLVEAGYPGASILGNAVCGMAAAKITSKDFLFWFRSHTANEIKWGGAKHDPTEKDDGWKMHPRSSFKAFLDVVKHRSVPWEDVEMDAIHSLQLILRGSLQDEIVDNSWTMVKVPTVDARTKTVDALTVVTDGMVRLIETASVPIMAVDTSGNINGWNEKAAEVTGLLVEQAIGMPLIDVVKDDSVEVVKNMLYLAMQGKEEKSIEIKLKTFGPQKSNSPVVLVINACSSRDSSDNIIGVCFIGQDITEQKMVVDKFTRIQGDYLAIVQNPSALIPPIFMIDSSGYCLEWNDAMHKLTGLKRAEAIGRLLVGEVFSVQNLGCRVKDHDTFTKLRILLNSVIAGQDGDKLLFGFFHRKGDYVEVLLSANKRMNSEGLITGVLCFLHVSSPELQHALQVQRMSEQAAMVRHNELAYIRQEIRNPLNGIIFTRNLMDASDLTQEQKHIVRKSTLCQEQLAKILDDIDLASIEECYLEMTTIEFNLGEALETVISQGMPLSKDRQVDLLLESPEEVSSMCLYGDNLRLQQVLSNFLTNVLRFIPTFEGSSVVLKVTGRKEHLGAEMHIVHLEFRIVHPAPGLPGALIQEMFHHSEGVSREGLGLYISQKLVKIMNGTVQYLREAEMSSFIVLVEFPLVQRVQPQ
ncbi:hypothetical protein AQUCO_11000027v1 [Aquilegia coerulea]|uniref:Phytochrome n=1 Tax=Aquilegia coerulea TaxID=218851 RepID=A0A2G5C2W0_AQUCA|nr:hypothetical protein AQUCO_11000027v1 [Aquilegia coerulea]